MKNYILACVLVGTVALLVQGNCPAQHVIHRPVQYHQPTYHQPTYYPPQKTKVVYEKVVETVPVPVPVIVPAFSFQYSPPCVPAPQKQMTAADNNAQLREFAKVLVEEIRRGQSTQGTPPAVPGAVGDDGPPTLSDGNAPTQPVPVQQPVQSPVAQPVPTQPPTQPPGGGGNPPAAGGPNPQSKYAQLALSAFKRNCATCHTGIGSEGDAVIFSQPGVLNPNAPWKSMLKEIQRGHMPPKKSTWQPTPDETASMIAWLSGQ